MWTFDRSEVVVDGVLLYFFKGNVTRNTIIPTLTDTAIQELITQWEIEDSTIIEEAV